MLRRACVVACAAALAVTGAAGATRGAPVQKRAVAPAATFFISGRGWGHGVGLSQWGAYGFAQRGASYERILAHYYRGTILGNAPVARVRVLLGEGRKSVTVSSETAFRVRDGSGTVHELAAGAYAFGPGLRVKVDPEKPPQALRPPLLFTSGGSHLRYGGAAYRGQLQVNAGRSALQVVNNVGLEAYLYGVVPREVPFAWPTEALKAQAVVARSYALAVRKTGAFDLYADVRSQVYGGVAAEKPTTNAAVDATAGQVLLYGGKVATTFFFSTSGGRTASVQHVWSGGTPIPYLVSVPDPYDSHSPHHSWGPFRFTAAKLVSTFKVRGRLVDVRLNVNDSQRVQTATFVGTKGETTVSGADVRTRLGLRSTWFRVGILALDRPRRVVEYGAQTKLTGTVRGTASATLEQRVSGKVWEPAARVKPSASGRVEVAVKPLASTDYRLAYSAKLAGPPIRVSVSPRVRLQAPTEPSVLRGTVRPIVRGARVEIQRLVGAKWRLAAATTVDGGGAFEARLDLTPATYRARVVPRNGLVVGFSPVLRVLG